MKDNWKEFKLQSIFGDAVRGTRITKANRISGDIAFVTAGESNQGVTEYISNDEAITYEDALTIDMFGNCFYHNYEFKCDDNILVIKNEKLNEYSGNFIACIINRDKYKHAYGRQYRQEDYADHVIKLPEKNNEPDWQKMEAYIKKVTSNTIKQMDGIIKISQNDKKTIGLLSKIASHTSFNEWSSKYINKNNNELKYEDILNITNWKEFKLQSIFGDAVRGTRITKANRISGDIAFVTAGESNQGVTEYISNDEAITYEDALTIDMFGNCFYHNYEFKCDDNILVIKNEKLNEYSGNFIACIINRDKYKHAYGRQYRQEDYADHVIKLPEKNNEPDWQKMEAYVKSLLNTHGNK